MHVHARSSIEERAWKWSSESDTTSDLDESIDQLILVARGVASTNVFHYWRLVTRNGASSAGRRAYELTACIPFHCPRLNTCEMNSPTSLCRLCGIIWAYDGDRGCSSVARSPKLRKWPRLVIGWVTTREDRALWTGVRSLVWTWICDWPSMLADVVLTRT